MEAPPPVQDEVVPPGERLFGAPELPPLPLDLFEHILAALADGADLHAASGVCRKWRAVCLSKHFWVALVRRRWHVETASNPRLCRAVSGDGGLPWLEMYKNFERALKLPVSHWTKERAFPPFAHTLTARLQRKLERKRKDERRGKPQRSLSDPLASGAAGALVWVTVRHYDDCRLRDCGVDVDCGASSPASAPRDTHTRCLELRVVVQNTRDEPLWLRPSAIALDCRPPPTSSGVQCTLEQGWADGWSTRTVAGDGSLRYVSLLPLPLPSAGGASGLEGGLAACAATRLGEHNAYATAAERAPGTGDWIGKKECDAPRVSGSICLRERWSFAVLGSLRFPVGMAALGGVHLEPEALERCVRLRVPLFRRCADAGAHDEEAVAVFDEERIWAHYSNVSSNIWFFDPQPAVL